MDVTGFRRLMGHWATGVSVITAEGETNNWDAVGLAVPLRTQNGIIIGRDGHTWRDAGTQCVSFLDRVRALAYPG